MYAKHTFITKNLSDLSKEPDRFFHVPWGNRTLNCPLGGGCYIHLTKETYRPGNRDFLIVLTTFMNYIT